MRRSACFLLTYLVLAHGRLPSNGLIRAQSASKEPRTVHATQALKSMPSGRYSRKADVYINVDRSYTHRVSSRGDQDASLTSYMRLPADPIIFNSFPAKLKPVDGNRYVFAVPPMKFFDWELNPVAYSTLNQTESAIVIECNDVTLKGPPLIESLNGRFHFQQRTELSWQDRALDRAITARSQVEMWVTPPAPFNFIPAPLGEATASAVFGLVLDGLHREFLNALGKDLDKFLTSRRYRDELASTAESETSEKAQRPTSLQLIADHPATEATRIPCFMLIGPLMSSGIALAAMHIFSDRRARSVAAMPLLVTKL